MSKQTELIQLLQYPQEDAEWDEVIQGVDLEARRRGWQGEAKLLIGGELTDSRTHWPKITRLEKSRRQGPVFWLGEPISILGGPIEVELNRELANNLLLVGNDRVFSPLLALLLELCASASDTRWRLFYDFEGQIHDRVNAVLSRMAGEGTLARVQRLNPEDLAGTIHASVDDGIRILIFVWNLEMVSAIKEQDNDFLRLLRTAPAAGVHIIAWSPVLSGREILLSEETVSAFRYRAAGAMDRYSFQKVGDPGWAFNISRDRGVLFSAGTEPVVFSPYSNEFPIAGPLTRVESVNESSVLMK
jgi:hypothetical protein